MHHAIRIVIAASVVALQGCAGLDFYDAPKSGAFTYHEASPFAAIIVATDCTISVSAIALPGAARSIAFRSGFGSAKLSIKTANGMITDIGQETDTKIPETITAIGGLAKSVSLGLSAADGKPAQGAKCAPQIKLFAIDVDPQTNTLGFVENTALQYQAIVLQQEATVPSPPRQRH